MFVSTREATSVEVFTSPAALDFVGLPRGLFCARRLALRPASFALSLPLGRFIKQTQPFLDAECLLLSPAAAWEHYPNRIPSRHPVQLIAGADAVLVGYGLGKRKLQLTGNLAHVLTIARTISLPKTQCVSNCFRLVPQGVMQGAIFAPSEGI